MNTILENATETAKKIRNTLKDVLPTVKFSVTVSRGSMVSSVRVSWTDGPLEDDVEELLSKFKSGYYDGMHDMYVSTNGYYFNGQYYNGAHYITSSRILSEDRRLAINQYLEANFQFDVYPFFTKQQTKAAEEILIANGDFNSYSISIPEYLIVPAAPDNVIPFPKHEHYTFTSEEKMKFEVMSMILGTKNLNQLLQTKNINDIFSKTSNFIYGEGMRYDGNS